MNKATKILAITGGIILIVIMIISILQSSLSFMSDLVFIIIQCVLASVMLITWTIGKMLDDIYWKDDFNKKEKL